MVLNLTLKEAVHLRRALRERRRSLLFERDHKRWLEWPEGKIYRKLCKMLGKKR